VFVSGQKRGVTPTIRREIKRRAGIEPVIGYLKEDGHLGRNFLVGSSIAIIASTSTLKCRFILISRCRLHA
jgi:hypothetical protein